MNDMLPRLLWCLGLLFPFWTAPPAAGQSSPKDAQMYEDIEIMSRILDRALDLPRYSTAAVPLSFQNRNGGLIGFGGGIAGLQGGGSIAGLQGGGSFAGALGLQGAGNPGSGFAGSSASFSGIGGGFAGNLGGSGFQGGRWASVPHVAFPRTQAAYVKDHGVVFTLTLPPKRQPKAATTTPPAPKPATEWEQIRAQLRGEKPVSAAPPPKKEERSAADVVLDVLAKNGHHFSQLTEKESLTVSIVFRDAQPVSQTVAHDPANPFDITLTEELPILQGEHDNADGPVGGTEPQKQKGDKNPVPDSSGPSPANTEALREAAFRALMTQVDTGASTGSAPNDYELLGDLHLKQGQSKQALQAYQKAVDKNADPQHAAGLYLKIAQLYLTFENDRAEARKAIDKARELIGSASGTKKEAAKPSAVGSPLPSRLVITVPKRVLDRAEMSMEEFKKAATVEYLSFRAPKTPPEASDPKSKRVKDEE
jgi:hypothetical protein